MTTLIGLRDLARITNIKQKSLSNYFDKTGNIGVRIIKGKRYLNTDYAKRVAFVFQNFTSTPLEEIYEKLDNLHK